MHDRIEHAQFNVLSISGSFTREQGSRDALRNSEPGKLVRHNGPHQRWSLIIRSGLHRGKAGKRLY